MIDIQKDFRILDFQPVTAGDGDSIIFLYKGTRFIYEVWSTGNADGRDFTAYDNDTGKQLTGDDLLEAYWPRDDSDEVFAFLDKVYDLWLENKEKIVHPAWEHAVWTTLVMAWDTIQFNDPSDPEAP